MRRLSLACLLALTLPAHAGLFDDDEARARIEKLRQDLVLQTQQISSRLDTLSKNQLDFTNQLEALRADLSRLRGQVELLLNDLEATQKRQRDFYIDLDNRLRKLETAANEAATKPAENKPADSSAKPDPAAELRDYEAALHAFKAAKYREAASAFAAFIKAYPSSTMLPAAHYWAASSHFQLKEFALAAQLFGQLVETWPNDARVPDALLGQANALAANGDATGSRQALETLVTQYPQSQAAQTARERLKNAAPPPTRKK